MSENATNQELAVVVFFAAGLHALAARNCIAVRRAPHAWRAG